MWLKSCSIPTTYFGEVFMRVNGALVVSYSYYETDTCMLTG